MEKLSRDFLRDTLHKPQAIQKYDNKGPVKGLYYYTFMKDSHNRVRIPNL